MIDAVKSFFGACKKTSHEATKAGIAALLTTAFVFGGTLLLIIFVPQGPLITITIAFSMLLLFLWWKAGTAVFDSLIAVSGTAGVVISVVLFITQSYCQLPVASRTATESLKFLYLFGMVYALYLFGRSIFKRIQEDDTHFRSMSGGKRSWLTFGVYGLLLIVFLWQFYAVVHPIMNSLCIF